LAIFRVSSNCSFVLIIKFSAMKFKPSIVPVILGLTLFAGACSNSQVETPSNIDGTVQEGVDGLKQNAEDAGTKVQEGVDGLKQNAEDAGTKVQEGVDGLKQNAEDATGTTTPGQ
jgi:hypothetical protein